MKLLLEAPEILRGGAKVSVVSAAQSASTNSAPDVCADDAAKADLFRPRLIEFGETREETIVSARPFVREELVVGRSTGRRVERIEETVRRTEVEVDDLPAREQGTSGRG
jgi:stress response protein YsnF